MKKTEEELTELKTKYEKLQKELSELTEEELEKVTGGVVWSSISIPSEKPFKGCPPW